MEQSTAQRRLVKSPPELWAELSSHDALNRHLAPFGEIRITRVDPETTVAWEGDRASGTVQLAPAGWGTQVTLTASAVAPAREPQPEPAPPATTAVTPPRPEPPAAPPQEAKPGFLARLFRRRPRTPQLSPPAPGPEPPPPDPDPAPTLHAPQPAPAPAPQAARAAVAPILDRDRTVAILADVLDDLGAAHHRPFSRG